MRRTILLLSVFAGAIGMLRCGGDDNVAPADGGTTRDSAADAKVEAAADASGNQGGAGGGSSLDSGASADAQQDATPGTGGSGQGGGGVGGSGGSGGAIADASPDAPVCPSSAPTPGSSCTNYGNLTCGDCTCKSSGIGQRTWRCGETDAEAGASCPSQQPADYSDCDNPTSSVVCPAYGTVTCRCRNRDNKWWCIDTSVQADAGCPVNAPTTNQACTQANLSCQIGTQRCQCDSKNRWQCSAIEAGTDAAPDVVIDATPDAIEPVEAGDDAALDAPAE